MKPGNSYRRSWVAANEVWEFYVRQRSRFSCWRLMVMVAGLLLYLTIESAGASRPSQLAIGGVCRSPGDQAPNNPTTTGSQQIETSLEPGKPVEQAISGQQSHLFTIKAEQNQYFHVSVEQGSVDLMVTLFAPDGTKIIEADQTGTFAPETILGVMQPKGEYRIQVRPVEDSSGNYRITLKELRNAQEPDGPYIAAMTAAFEAVAEADELRGKQDKESLNLAVEKYSRALNTWRESGELFWQATTLDDLGRTSQKLGQNKQALEFHGQALNIFRKIGNRSHEALTLDLTASVYNAVGASTSERRKALEYYNQSLQIFRELQDRDLEVMTLNNIGLIYNDLGEHRTSLDFFNRALLISKSITTQNVKAKTLYNLGRAQDLLGEKQKALEFYNEALPVFRAVGNGAGESRTIHNIGSVYHSLGEMQRALELYAESLKLDRTAGDQIGEGTNLNDIGGVYSSLGQMERALEYYNQALPVRRAAGDKSGEATTLNNIGGHYDSWGERQRALDFFNQALTVCRSVGDRSGEAIALNNIGQTYGRLGEPRKAIEFYDHSLRLSQALEDRGAQATTLSNLGSSYDDLGDRRKALDHYLKALSLHRAVGERSGEANTLNNIGTLLSDAGDNEQALKYYNQALSLFGAIDDVAGQAVVLNNFGEVYAELGHQEKALKSHNLALVMNRLIGDRNGEALALGNLLLQWKKSGKPGLAIFYGKQAVNLFQSLRGSVQGLEKSIQKSYLAKIEPTYRFLADLLIAEGRLVEAQQALNLFKDQQFFDFGREQQKQTALLTLTPGEASLLQRYEQTTNRFGKVGQRVVEIKRTIGKREPTPQETAQLQKSEVEFKNASEEFLTFIKGLETYTTSPSDKIVETADLREMQSALRELSDQSGHTVVAVYTLVGDETFRALVITPTVITAAAQPAKLETLDEKALQLWGLMQSDRYNPVPLAQELYAIVFKPIEALLPKDTNTILWSLDRNLRYLPTAALHDGKQYLVERYNQVVFTRADRERLVRRVSPHWTGLGLGSSEAHTVEVLGDKVSFAALPGVTEELHALFRQKGSPHGVIDGEILADKSFTKVGMLAALKQKRPLVHISSHFSFRPGDEARSFLLLGEGNAMTLEEMRQQVGLFDGVELLTLSACNTAAQQAGADGREIDGFAELAQRLGAASVMATLWPVADNSTPWLMREFYQGRESGQGLTKAEAFRKAQLALLTGTAETKPLPANRNGSSPSISVVVDDAKRNGSERGADIVYVAAKDAPAFKRDNTKPFAHPYYWAPFILIGNWK